MQARAAERGVRGAPRDEEPHAVGRTTGVEGEAAEHLQGVRHLRLDAVVGELFEPAIE